MPPLTSVRKYAAAQERSIHDSSHSKKTTLVQSADRKLGSVVCTIEHCYFAPSRGVTVALDPLLGSFVEMALRLLLEELTGEIV